MWRIAEFVASFQILLTTMAPSRTQELFMISQLSKWCSKLKCQFVNLLHNIGRTFLYFPINHRRRRRGQKGITVDKKICRKRGPNCDHGHCSREKVLAACSFCHRPNLQAQGLGVMHIWCQLRETRRGSSIQMCNEHLPRIHTITYRR